MSLKDGLLRAYTRITLYVFISGYDRAERATRSDIERVRESHEETQSAVIRNVSAVVFPVLLVSTGDVLLGDRVFIAMD